MTTLSRQLINAVKILYIRYQYRRDARRFRQLVGAVKEVDVSAPTEQARNELLERALEVSNSYGERILRYMSDIERLRN
ncbi:hypothetical protein ACLPJK_26325 [Pseudomonas aeruginosa]|uniref:hypothetical protein n=1 Tax=Pseudomonas aeruginosa TaxID=287 RepID=UPI003D28A878